jgi:hypothetical protein
VYARTQEDIGEVLSLDEALERGLAEVRELGAGEADPVQGRHGGGAQVNKLVLENKGTLPILVLAGTIVKGGKQDRQIGQDFVIQAKSTTPVDAFCVEQGRWQSDRLGQETEGKFQVLDGVATAKVRMKGQYEKDQGGVWQEVATLKFAMAAGVASGSQTSSEDAEATILVGDAAWQEAALESSSFAVAFDANAAAAAEDLERCAGTVQKHFAAHEGAVGFAYAINGKPIAVRTFAHPRLLTKHLKSFVRGMATEAHLAPPTDAPPAARAEDVVALVKRISSAEEKVASTKGLNRNGVRACEIGFNGNCYVNDKEGRQVAITQDWTAR